MAVTYVSTKITQRKVTFSIDKDSKVDVILTDHYGCNLTISERKRLTIKELIDICSLIYSEGIVKTSETITVYLEGDNPIYVRGSQNIVNAFIESIFVEVSDSMER